MSSSWQVYVDTNLVGAGLAQAAIVGIQGGVWATSSGITLQAKEISTLSGAFNDASGIRANGLFLSGAKYFVLRADDLSIYGKLDQGGAICVKTKQTILIGIYDASMMPGAAANIVEKLADELINRGY